VGREQPTVAVDIVAVGAQSRRFLICFHYYLNRLLERRVGVKQRPIEQDGTLLVCRESDKGWEKFATYSPIKI
jgi:hypothetical protein